MWFPVRRTVFVWVKLCLLVINLAAVVDGQQKPPPKPKKQTPFEIKNEIIDRTQGTVDFVNQYMDPRKNPGQRIASCDRLMWMLMGNPPTSADTFFQSIRSRDPPNFEVHSIYFRFVHGYHIGIPALDHWQETLEYYQHTRPTHIDIWEVKRDLKTLHAFEVNCKKKADAARKFNINPQSNDPEYKVQLEKELGNCYSSPLIDQLRTENPYLTTPAGRLTFFEERVFQACRGAATSMIHAYLASWDPMPFNGVELPYTYAPFPNMEADVERMETELQPLINEVLDRITEAENAKDVNTYNQLNIDFNHLLLLGNAGFDIRFRPPRPYYPYFFLNSNTLNPGVNQFIKDIRKADMTRFKDTVMKIWTDPTETQNGKISYEQLVTKEWNELGKFVMDLDAGEVKRFVEDKLYGSIFDGCRLFVDTGGLGYTGNPNNRVPPQYRPPHHWMLLDQLVVDPTGSVIKTQRSMLHMTLIADAIWDWVLQDLRDPSGQIVKHKSGIHNLRLAWDLLGALLEEMKCLLDRTYHGHMRSEALNKTQLDLEKGALFSGISTTLFKPCRIEDELDLVSPYCTRENHEICAPAGPLHPEQRTDSILHGGLSLLKPRWHFERLPEPVEVTVVLNPGEPDPTKLIREKVKRNACRGRRDYVMQYNTCRCGFRMDCGKGLPEYEQITCQLVENDLVRKQCRGTVAYPCKSVPLAPGKHNESCQSGYCDMLHDSCEDGPFTHHYFKGGALPSSLKRTPGDSAGLIVLVLTLSWTVSLLISTAG